jgi:two-component system, OmpR family, sensor histidine kinase MprB
VSFRARVTVLVAAAIAVTVAAASTVVWFVARHELYDQLDSTLYTQANTGGPFGHNVLTIVIDPTGEINGSPTLVQLIPITARIRSVVNGKSSGFYASTDTTNDLPIRELVLHRDDGSTLIAVQPLRPTLHALHRIRFWVLLIGALGIAVAAALAAFVATAVLRPVRRLTTAAETVTATGNLTERVEVGGDDELGRLATRFNGMLAALEESVGRQRRLVADASHELRTPLTAARTNVDLVREGKLPEEEVRHALDEASVELDSLTSLVSDLVELARGEERKLRLEDVALDDLVSSAIERAKSRAPGATFVTSLTPVQVRVDPVLVERAVGNLLDNAVKYSPPGAPIEVSVRDGEVVVADRGPGIAEEDLPRIFDRFYRAATARAKPGAGLGLAIVREAAEAHGGQATAESSALGARFRLTLPAAT